MSCRWSRALLLLLLLVPALPLIAQVGQVAGEVGLDHAALRVESPDLVLDAEFVIRLGPVVAEALERGVPLTLQTTVRSVRARRLWWDAIETETSHRASLSYHALSRRYVLQDVSPGQPDPGTQRVFFRRDAALKAWGAVIGLTVMPLADWQRLPERRVEVRARLDVDALPHPLRTVAYVSPDWRLASDWVRVPVDTGLQP